MGNMQSGSRSASHHTVDVTNRDLTWSESKEMKGFTLAQANGDPIRCLYSFVGSWLLLLPLTEPSWPVQSNWGVNPGSCPQLNETVLTWLLLQGLNWAPPAVRVPAAEQPGHCRWGRSTHSRTERLRCEPPSLCSPLASTANYLQEQYCLNYVYYYSQHINMHISPQDEIIKESHEDHLVFKDTHC